MAGELPAPASPVPPGTGERSPRRTSRRLPCPRGIPGTPSRPGRTPVRDGRTPREPPPGMYRQHRPPRSATAPPGTRPRRRSGSRSPPRRGALRERVPDVPGPVPPFGGERQTPRTTPRAGRTGAIPVRIRRLAHAGAPGSRLREARGPLRVPSRQCYALDALPRGAEGGGDVLPGAGRRLDRPAVTPIMAIPSPPGEGGRPYGARVHPRVAAPGRVPGPVRRAPRRRRPSSRTGRAPVPAIRIQSDNAFDYRDQAAAPGVGPQGLADQHRLRATARRPPAQAPGADSDAAPGGPVFLLGAPRQLHGVHPGLANPIPPAPVADSTGPPPARGEPWGPAPRPTSRRALAGASSPLPAGGLPARPRRPGRALDPLRSSFLDAERHRLAFYIYLMAFWVAWHLETASQPTGPPA